MGGMELSEFLLARIAEDDAAARAAMTDAWGEQVGTRHGYDWASLALSSTRDTTADQDEHITRWNPARALAECEAKRRIVKELATTRKVVSEIPSGSGRLAAQNGLDAVVRLLALPYADHPDYREEWKP